MSKTVGIQYLVTIEDEYLDHQIGDPDDEYGFFADTNTYVQRAIRDAMVEGGVEPLATVTIEPLSYSVA